MRIIAGKFKGRRLVPNMNNWPTRPTTDFAKESLFNILGNRDTFPPQQALDLFSGTGCISYELLSRGSELVWAVEKNRKCIKFIEQTTEKLGVDTSFHLVSADVFSFLKTCRRTFDLIFADPPYDLSALPSLPNLIFAHKLLNKSGVFILEHGPNHDFNAHPNLLEIRNYGRTTFSFFMNKEDLEEE